MKPTTGNTTPGEAEKILFDLAKGYSYPSEAEFQDRQKQMRKQSKRLIMKASTIFFLVYVISMLSIILIGTDTIFLILMPVTFLSLAFTVLFLKIEWDIYGRKKISC